MAPNGRVRPTCRKAGIVRIFSFLKLLVILSTLLMQEEANGASLKGAKSADSSANNDLFVRPEFGFTYDEMEEAAQPQDREKRVIPPSQKTNVVSMLFFLDKEEKIRENISDLTTNDMIIRMQEKYEGPICEQYLESVSDLKNRYFYFDHWLSQAYRLQSPDEYQIGQHKFKNRYRVLTEICNMDNEKAFWREMFELAEADQARYLRNKQPTVKEANSNSNKDKTTTTTPIPDDRFIYLQVSMAEMIWNEIWFKYQDKSVCNQKLLLECIEARSEHLAYLKQSFGIEKLEPGIGVCECRTKEVGIPSVFPTGNIYEPEGPNVHELGRFQRIFVTPYYTKKVDTKNGEEVHRLTANKVTDLYDIHLRCVAQANMSPVIFERPMLITNPCDFSLPMIGMCQADCVFNASCVSATPEEKEDVRGRAGKDWKKRIREQKVHAVFNKKCKCEKEKECYPGGTSQFKHSSAERSAIRPVNLLAFLTFSLCYLFCTSYSF